MSLSLFLNAGARVYSRRYFARGGLGGRHCRQDTVPAPRILQGPFRNVDPHTTSLAVYFRGPASELFNMLNPESPGAISVLARTCIYIYIYTHLCIYLVSPCLCARVCVCVYTTRNDNDVCSSLCRGYIYYGDEAGTRTFLRLLVLPATRARNRSRSKPRYVAATCRSGEVRIRIGYISVFRSNNFDKPGRMGINAVNFGVDIVSYWPSLRGFVSFHSSLFCLGFETE